MLHNLQLVVVNNIVKIPLHFKPLLTILMCIYI